MALRRCPECKKKISDTCDTCIHCGYKLKHVDAEGYDVSYMAEYYKDEPPRPVLKAIGIIFGSILAVLAVALLIYTFVKHEELDFVKSVIMEAVGVVSLIGGVTCAVLCDRLL